MARTTKEDIMPSLTTLPERVSVIEVKVENINEKLDDMKEDISKQHETVLATLKSMREESTVQHSELAGKVKDLEGFKNKWVKYGIAVLSFLAGLGWLHTVELPQILKFLGL